MFFLAILLLASIAHNVCASSSFDAGGATLAQSGPAKKPDEAKAKLQDPGNSLPPITAESFAQLKGAAQNNTLTLIQVKPFIEGVLSDTQEHEIAALAKAIYKNACHLKRKASIESYGALRKLTFQEVENAIAGLELIKSLFDKDRQRNHQNKVMIDAHVAAHEVSSIKENLMSWFDPCGFNKVDEWSHRGDREQLRAENFNQIIALSQSKTKQAEIDDWLTKKYDDAVMQQFKNILHQENFSDCRIVAVIDDPSHADRALLKKAINEGRGFRDFQSVCKECVQDAEENKSKETFKKALMAIALLGFYNSDERDSRNNETIRESFAKLVAIPGCEVWIFDEVERAVQHGRSFMNTREFESAKRWFNVLDRCDFSTNAGHELRRTQLKEAFNERKKIVQKIREERNTINISYNFPETSSSSLGKVSSLFSVRNIVGGIVIACAAYYFGLHAKSKDPVNKAKPTA